MMNLRLKDRKGFTLIELLIVVAIIGIIAAIAIPNLLNAIQRGKQKRSMADVRTIGTACETYSIDYNVFPVQAGVAAVSGIEADVIPNYIKKLPALDAWNTAIQYNCADGSSYTVSSNGKAATYQDPAWLGVPGGSTQYFESDIVFCDGGYYQWPEGPQSNMP